MSQEVRLLLKQGVLTDRERWLIFGASPVDVGELDSVTGGRADFYTSDRSLHSEACAGAGERALEGAWCERTGYDAALVFLPKSNARRDLWLSNAAHCVKAEGRVILVGAKAHGIKSARPAVMQHFTKVVNEAYGFHSHLFVARGPNPQGEPGLTSRVQPWTMQGPNGALEVQSLPGVFSKGRLDAGTQLLLENLTLSQGHSLLDLGSGAGIIGTLAARDWKAGRVLMTDVDHLAVASSALTAARAGLAPDFPIEARVSDVYADVAESFDVIVSNPPFHQGMETDQRVPTDIIEGAPAHLRKGGELWLVANAFLPYWRTLDRTFGAHEVMAKNGRFVVYRAKLA
jgi:16S rRNA (guanine1207-N2)-methyltransferase